MSHGRTALIIDDEPDIREVLIAILESGGFQVDTLSDGIDALALKKWYDVILLDLKMPVFDGRRLIDYWRLTAPEILPRVVVLTGYDRVAAEETATFARLSKPFDYKTVMKVVNECLAHLQPLESSEPAI
ncbi:MAG TPA: response regulator [Gemmatimonadaceae bacterium]